MLALVGLAAWSIWVNAPAPPPTCSLAGEVTTALAALVPEAAVHAGAAAADGDLTLTVTSGAEDGGVAATAQVLLTDASGAALLERALPAGGSCQELADGIALVVERYLHDLGWQAGEVTLEVRRTGAVTPEKRPARRARLRVDVAARGQLAVGGVHGGGAVAMMAGGGRLRAAVEVGGSWPRTDDVHDRSGESVGSVETWTAHVLAGASGQRGRLVAAIWAGGERLAAAADGPDVFQRRAQAGWQGLGRVEAGVELPLADRLALRLVGGVEVRPAAIEVRVEGAALPHRSPAVRGLAAAGLAWRWR